MIRSILSTVAGQPWLRKAIVSTPGIRDIAWQFVAGEDLDAGVAAVKQLNANAMKGTLNFIGTHIREKAEAISAAEANIAALERMGQEGLDCNLSVKLTQIGLDIDESMCRHLLRRILDSAEKLGNFVCIDMEESPYVEKTLAIFEDMLQLYGPATVGIVLQSYLRQRRGDLRRLLDAGASIRLVKGGYWETSEIVYRRKSQVEQVFREDLELLLTRGWRPAIATHDAGFLFYSQKLSAEAGIAPDSFELQLLYGVRTDLQKRLIQEGFNVRCYVPYGGNWYAYTLGCIRRIPEGILRRINESCRRVPF
ncbi:MAG: proline dehydrogenase family protein [Syntrophotaleaceae bacterium]